MVLLSTHNNAQTHSGLQYPVKASSTCPSDLTSDHFALAHGSKPLPLLPSKTSLGPPCDHYGTEKPN